MDRSLGISGVLIVVRVSHSTLRRMEAAGLFPRRRQISIRRVGWSESDINTWLTSKQ